MTVVPGDGIGPEVVSAARMVLDASGPAIAWDVQEAGASAREAEGVALPDRVVDSIKRSGVALKGPLQTAADLPHGSPNVELRERLGLHTTIRPCRALAGIETLRPDLDVVIVKMNQEDLYARLGLERGTPIVAELREALGTKTAARIAADAAVSLRPLSATAAAKTIEAAFSFARANGRRRVTAVHKAQLIPETDGLFLETARQIGGANPDVELDDALVDTVCERLITRPSAYDVLVMPRMYGDIVSGVSAALVGGPGLAPGVNLGEDCAVFEAAHGTAPHRAGSDRVNPLAVILSGAMLLRHLGESGAADRVEGAVERVLREGLVRTYDLAPPGEPATTQEMARAVVDTLDSAAA